MKKNSRYQDYVIKDGKFIGEFEDMYRDYEDPWNQTTREIGSLEKIIGIDILKNKGHVKPLEYGCGLGHYTNRLYDALGNAGGVDISETAVKKAKLFYPHINFFKADVLDFNVVDKFNPDCLCYIEISWYILDKIDNLKDGLSHRYSGKGFYHTLQTYDKGQSYGLDYFTDIDDIVKYWEDIVDITEWGVASNPKSSGGKRTYLYGKIK